MTKGFIAGLVAAAFCGAPVLAADMPVKAPDYKAIDPGFGWTGCYVGVEGGGAWGRMKQVESDPASPLFGGTEARPKISGGLAGGTAGCNYQTGSWVLGVEGDLSWANIRGLANDLPPFTTAFINGAKITSFDTARGRFGYAVNRAFWYVTGGAAFANVEAIQFPPGGAEQVVTKRRSVGIVGGGVEWALADPHWSVKAEYLHVSFGKTEVTGLDHTIQINENIIRIGLNYRFGGPGFGKGPVSAKY
jgi:outer membrane immunogenic protein